MRHEQVDRRPESPRRAAHLAGACYLRSIKLPSPRFLPGLCTFCMEGVCAGVSPSIHCSIRILFVHFLRGIDVNTIVIWSQNHTDRNFNMSGHRRWASFLRWSEDHSKQISNRGNSFVGRSTEENFHRLWMASLFSGEWFRLWSKLTEAAASRQGSRTSSRRSNDWNLIRRFNLHRAWGFGWNDVLIKCLLYCEQNR
jgi:hypothetical protein